MQATAEQSAPLRKGGANARSAAMLCNDQTFRHWLDRNRGMPTGTHDSEEAAIWMRIACKVNSRADLDHDDYGKKMFRKIMRTYLDDRGSSA